MLFMGLGPPIKLGFPVSVTGNIRTADVGTEQISECKQEVEMEQPLRVGDHKIET